MASCMRDRTIVVLPPGSEDAFLRRRPGRSRRGSPAARRATRRRGARAKAPPARSARPARCSRRRRAAARDRRGRSESGRAQKPSTRWRPGSRRRCRSRGSSTTSTTRGTRGTSENRRRVGPEVGPTAVFHSRTPTGMRGPACVFWVNLTHFSPQAARPVRGGGGGAGARPGGLRPPARQPRGAGRARSLCRFAPPLIRFIPYLLTYSVPRCASGCR